MFKEAKSRAERRDEEKKKKWKVVAKLENDLTTFTDLYKEKYSQSKITLSSTGWQERCLYLPDYNS